MGLFIANKIKTKQNSNKFNKQENKQTNKKKNSEMDKEFTTCDCFENVTAEINLLKKSSKHKCLSEMKLFSECMLNIGAVQTVCSIQRIGITLKTV